MELRRKKARIYTWGEEKWERLGMLHRGNCLRRGWEKGSGVLERERERERMH